MAYQDIYQIALYQKYYSQEVLNVFYYRHNNASSNADASDLAASFVSQVCPVIQNFQTSAVRQERIVVQNLFDSSDRLDSLLSLVGLRANLDAEKAFVAVGFRLDHDNGSIRPGSKRFAGLDEGDVANGVITNTTAITRLNALGIALTQALTVAAVNVFVPVVVKRILDATGYRLPATLSEAVIGVIQQAIWNVIATSQVSRKIGVGS